MVNLTALVEGKTNGVWWSVVPDGKNTILRIRHMSIVVPTNLLPIAVAATKAAMRATEKRVVVGYRVKALCAEVWRYSHGPTKSGSTTKRHNAHIHVSRRAAIADMRDWRKLVGAPDFDIRLVRVTRRAT